MQLKAGYGGERSLSPPLPLSSADFPVDEGKSPAWLTCKRAHAGRLDWGLKTSITFVWLSIYQYTDFHFSSAAEPGPRPSARASIRRRGTFIYDAASYFSPWSIARLPSGRTRPPPKPANLGRCFMLPRTFALISSWSLCSFPRFIHLTHIYSLFPPELNLNDSKRRK